MWIIPKNHPIFSVFAQDMVASKLELKKQLGRSRRSLMWRSKLSQIRTWLTRWKPGSWFLYLSGRILKHSARTSFETKLISSLADIHVSHSVQPESEKGKKIPGTYGHGSEKLSKLSGRDSVFLKTSKDISVSDCEKSLPIWLSSDTGWKTIVENQRGDYSRRLKLELHTREKEFLSWRTPATLDPGVSLGRLDVKPGQRFYDKKTGRNAQYGLTQQVQVKNWPTPASRDHKGADLKSRHGGASLSHFIQTGERTHGQLEPDNLNTTGKTPESWPTPNAPNPKNQIGAITEWGGSGNAFRTNGNHTKKLNPNWVEQLMGIKTGWTALDYAEME